MTTCYDAVIIGAGPVGSKAASLLAKEFNVLVIEKKGMDKRPVQCTGLISNEVLRSSSVEPSILGRSYGANIIFPNEKKISIRSDEQKAVLIDRNEFDILMAEKAMDDGAEYHYSERYISHRKENGKAIVTTDKEEIEASVIIGADGHRSVTAGTITDNRPKEYVKGFQADVLHESEDQRMITIRVGSHIAPGFFSWEIPFGNMLRIGLCVSENNGLPAEYFKKLLEKANVNKDMIKRTYCGRIPIGGRRRTYDDNMLLIGDAAGHVKPISGGGLQPSFKAAYSLSETVKEAFDENNFSEKFLSVYEKRWKRDIGKELRRGYRLRKMFTSLSDDELNKISEIVDKENITKILTSGNIDHPSDLIVPVMKDPVTALRLAPFMAKAGMRSMK
ncbi:MAG: NAD(P)/FAD-dependent oxidoreductase [Methanomassiliicoccaceae archaeon]|nr:NAD(P)/FAD-dependent oxidoreductase [Methanomassiliicoccaceae archaeon]